MPTKINNVVCYGDSVARGWGTPDRVGWPDLLGAHYHELNSAQEDNLARFLNQTVSSETADTLVNRVTWATERSEGAATTRSLWYRVGQPNLSIISIGGQDLFVNIREGHDPTDTSGFQRQLGRAASLLAELGGLMYVGIPAPHTSVASRRLMKSGLTVGILLQHYERVAATTIGQAARHADQPFGAVRLYQASQRAKGFSHIYDLQHPSVEGQEWIFNRVRPVFDKFVGVYERPVPDLSGISQSEVE
jgi:GDSL-like lipase/acylhydrolase family protein